MQKFASADWICIQGLHQIPLLSGLIAASADASAGLVGVFQIGIFSQGFGNMRLNEFLHIRSRHRFALLADNMLNCWLAGWRNFIDKIFGGLVYVIVFDNRQGIAVRMLKIQISM